MAPKIFHNSYLYSGQISTEYQRLAFKLLSLLETV